MKHFGSILEFTDRRNAELLAAWNKAMIESRHISLPAIAWRIVNTPCSRFWVSEERAMVVCSALMRGEKPLERMRPTKREMFLEIYRRVVVERGKGRTLAQAVSRVVNSPAPKFYMKPRCAIEIIYKIRNGFFEERKERQQRHRRPDE